MNILIVESENDEFFVRALLNHMGQDSVQVASIDLFKHSSLDKIKLTTQLSSALSSCQSRGISKIGVMLDLDNATLKERLDLVKTCFEEAYYENFEEKITLDLENTYQFVSVPIDNSISVQLACYFTNVDSEGELETVLKNIKTKDSVFADSLYDCWLPCVQDREKKMAKKGEQGDFNEKEVLKLWVDFYKRFDTLKKGDRNEVTTDWQGIWLGTTKNKKGEEKTIKARGAEIFDLNAAILNELKQFLAWFR